MDPDYQMLTFPPPIPEDLFRVFKEVAGIKLDRRSTGLVLYPSAEIAESVINNQSLLRLPRELLGLPVVLLAGPESDSLEASDFIFVGVLRNTKLVPNNWLTRKRDERSQSNPKRLHPTPGHSWFWDEEGEDGPQWALLLHDGSDTADDAGYIAIVPQEDGRWAVKVTLFRPKKSSPEGFIPPRILILGRCGTLLACGPCWRWPPPARRR
jgi:hypothetical protein